MTEPHPCVTATIKPCDDYRCGTTIWPCPTCNDKRTKWVVNPDEPAIPKAAAASIIDAELASWATLQDNEQAWAAVRRIRDAIGAA